MKANIGTKLYLGFGLLLVILIGLVTFNFIKVNELRALQDEGAQRAADAIETRLAMQKSYELYTTIADAQLNGYSDALKAQLSEQINEINEILAAIEKIADTDEEKQWSKRIRKDIEKAIDVFQTQMVPLLASRMKGEANGRITELDGQIDELLEEARKPLASFETSIVAESAEADKVFDSTGKSVQTIGIILAILGSILALLIAFIITRGITSTLASVVAVVQRIAKGDLQVQFDQKALTNTDETGMLARMMKEMADQLKETISFALEASENVSTGSEQLASASQGISQGSSEQAASVEEISSSIEEMTSSIHQNADNANQTEKIAMKSSADAKEGGEAVLRTVAAMKAIAEKISIIQEIARQTNLLSLNASIEAARAGEHGKGFAVVASAVQKLAERSQDAAEEISKLSKSSVDVAEKAGEMLNKLVPDIQKTAELVAEINAASAEQNKGTQQINTAIQQFNSVVQSNASASEQLASTSEELSQKAEELRQRLAFFQIESNTMRTRENNHRQAAYHMQPVHMHTPATHAPAHPAVHHAPIVTHKDAAHSHTAHDAAVAEQKPGVALNMGDEEDNNFQRM